ncbi:NACHT domain-containing protein [Aeromonas dhakensis]|uniref:NACHT domain-containing protein n=1 Tax=Aeromonas dhakensis TaxID=196024 RepID=UPI002891AAAF|nr:NACHT domain-containing protein [Aeromonas dhakensis]
MRDNIIPLFRKYGFEYRKSASNTDFLAFTYKTGFFHNAELVSLNIKERARIESEMESSVKELESLGFSTKKSFYNSIEEIDNILFEGFFNVPEWKERILSEYNEHAKKILSVLPKEANNYQYIKTPYYKNNKICDADIIDDICESLHSSGPNLIIVEAPAGFGKTCTSYEIIKNLVKRENNKSPIPFFTEFSRDRQARIFSHIFVREVDRTFSAVNSSVVIEEVKAGKIVVVLDGFDEILHDSSSSDESDKSFEDAEPMLETIGELLVNNAKVILTSRRSAIFDGEVLNEWLSRYDQKFVINRYRLEKPEIKDWLSQQRLDLLSQAGIDVYKLANPVLLSYLRFVEESTFQDLCNTPSRIVEQYFTAMLEREMDRQELRMNPEMQSNFLALIAEDMCNENYTSDTKERLITTIKNKASNILNEVRTLYSAKERPTLDKLATTLSNHAFFDRSNSDESKIEFINEFVFGNFIAANIVKSHSDWIASDERFVEPAVLSYAPRDLETRNLLWSKLGLMKEFIDSSSRMKFEGILTDRIDESVYDSCEITSLNIKGIPVFNSGEINHSIFNDCVFSRSTINFSNFSDVTFLNCSFWNCDFELEEDLDLNFFNCKSNDVLMMYGTDDEDILEASGEKGRHNLSDVEFHILDKIWPIGNNSIERLHHFVGQIIKSEKHNKKEMLKGMKKLKQAGYLVDAKSANFIGINKERISEIKNLLGRV